MPCIYLVEPGGFESRAQLFNLYGTNPVRPELYQQKYHHNLQAAMRAQERPALHSNAGRRRCNADRILVLTRNKL